MGNDTRPYDSSRRLQHSGDTSFKLAMPRGHWGTDPDGKGKNKYGHLLSEFRDVELELGEFGALSRAVDVDSETNTGHGNASRLR